MSKTVGDILDRQDLPRTAGMICTIETDRKEALYRCGERVRFLIAAKAKDGTPVTSGTVSCHIRREKGDLLAEYELDFSKGNPQIVTVSSDIPTFVWCTLNNPDNCYYPNPIAAAGFNVEEIRPAGTEPNDFDDFWQSGIKRVQNSPLEPIYEPMSEFTHPDFSAYRVSYAYDGDGTRMYGFLAVPKHSAGPFPCVVQVPGAGSGVLGPELNAFSDSRTMYLVMNVHAYEPSSENAVREAWNKLIATTLYAFQNPTDPERYYYRRVILGLGRVFEFLDWLPLHDHRTTICWGCSQGGAMALMLAGLFPKRVSCVLANVPAMCDHAGCLAGRSAGWPLLLENTTVDAISCANYYDTAFFARRIKAPVLLGLGYIDVACGPNSVYAMASQITAPLRILPFPQMGHDLNLAYIHEANCFLEQYLSH